MTKETDVFLHHILESIKIIENRIRNVTYEKFVNDIDVQDMVIRRLEVIGEAVRNLPKDFKQSHSEINWQNPADMRSVLIHGYFSVDLDVVWDTISNDLLPFKEQIKKLLS